jgi:hypothetical protein
MYIDYKSACHIIGNSSSILTHCNRREIDSLSHFLSQHYIMSETINSSSDTETVPTSDQSHKSRSTRSSKSTPVVLADDVVQDLKKENETALQSLSFI